MNFHSSIKNRVSMLLRIRRVKNCVLLFYFCITLYFPSFFVVTILSGRHWISHMLLKRLPNKQETKLTIISKNLYLSAYKSKRIFPFQEFRTRKKKPRKWVSVLTLRHPWGRHGGFCYEKPWHR